MAKPIEQGKRDFLKWDTKAQDYRFTGSYKEAVKFLRHYNADYDKYDLRKKIFSATKAKTKRDLELFFNAVENRGTVQLVRPSRKNRKIYAAAAQQPGNWKVYAVPVDSDSPRIHVRGKGKNRKVTIRGGVGMYELLIFDVEALAENPWQEVKRVLKGKKFDRAWVTCGAYSMKQGHMSIKTLTEQIIALMEQYEDAWGDWLNGIKILRFNSSIKKGEASYAPKQAPRRTKGYAKAKGR